MSGTVPVRGVGPGPSCTYVPIYSYMCIKILQLPTIQSMVHVGTGHVRFVSRIVSSNLPSFRVYVVNVNAGPIILRQVSLLGAAVVPLPGLRNSPTFTVRRSNSSSKTSSSSRGAAVLVFASSIIVPVPVLYPPHMAFLARATICV